MNKLYVLLPCALLLGFGVYERSARREFDRAAEVRQQQRLALRAAEDTRRTLARQQAEDDARTRTAARDAEAAAREAARLHEHEASLHTLDEQTSAHAARISDLTHQVVATTSRLAALRDGQLALETATFALARDIESQRIDRRSAELELQRATKMVAARLAASDWARGHSP